MRKVLSEDNPRFNPSRKFGFDFDPAFDNQDVDQFGFVNLSEAYSKGIIPGGLDMTEQDFNGVVNPGTLISRSVDVFDGIRKSEYVRSQLDKLNAEEREKAENALNRASEKQGVTVEQQS